MGEGANKSDRVGATGCTADFDVAGADREQGLQIGLDGRGGGTRGDRRGALRSPDLVAEGIGAAGGVDGEFLDLVGRRAGLDVGGAGGGV